MTIANLFDDSITFSDIPQTLFLLRKDAFAHLLPTNTSDPFADQHVKKRATRSEPPDIASV